MHKGSSGSTELLYTYFVCRLYLPQRQVFVEAQAVQGLTERNLRMPWSFSGTGASACYPYQKLGIDLDFRIKIHSRHLYDDKEMLRS